MVFTVVVMTHRADLLPRRWTDDEARASSWHRVGGHLRVRAATPFPPEIPAPGAIHADARWPRSGSRRARTSRRNGGRCSARPRSTASCARRSTASPTLARAGAKLRQAQEDLSARSGAHAVSQGRREALGQSRRRRIRNRSACRRCRVQTPFNLYLASVSVSYTFDLLRRQSARARGAAGRRRLPALRARGGAPDARRQRRHRGDPRGIAARADRATEEIVALQERQLAIVERLVNLGTAAHADVVAQRLRARAERAPSLPDLQRQLEQVRHRLAVYVGRPPRRGQAARSSGSPSCNCPPSCP